MKMKTILYMCACVLLTACGAGIPEIYTESQELPKVYPDVIDVTIPQNIAPLTFQLDGEADGMIARYQRDGVEVVCEDKMQPSMDQWRELTAHSCLLRQHRLVSQLSSHPILVRQLRGPYH